MLARIYVPTRFYIYYLWLVQSHSRRIIGRQVFYFDNDRSEKQCKNHILNC